VDEADRLAVPFGQPGPGRPDGQRRLGLGADQFFGGRTEDVSASRSRAISENRSAVSQVWLSVPDLTRS
jgi:hypothetical protein